MVNGLHYGYLLRLELKRVLPVRLNAKKNIKKCLGLRWLITATRWIQVPDRVHQKLVARTVAEGCRTLTPG